MKSFFLILILLLSSSVWGRGKPLHGISRYGVPKYSADFTHYDYVNPHAPKGGVIKIGRVGTFDRVDPIGVRGMPVYGLNFLFTRLMSRSADEPFSTYGLLAESIEIAPNYSWVIFNLRSTAVWHDGAPITPEDVIASLHLFQTQGSPAQQQLYKGIVKAEKKGPHQVKFRFDKRYATKESVLFLGQMPIVSKATDQKPMDAKNLPLGNGPYKIIEVIPGRSVVYQRIPHHWSENLPVNKGRYNFDEIHVEYFRNQPALLEAFKKGKITIYTEEDPKRWHTSFDIPAVHEGSIHREEFTHQHPVPIDVLVFNTRKPLFQDPQVRKALSLAFDFEWLNDKLYHQSLSRTHSYFENTVFAANEDTPAHWPKELRDRLTHAQHLLEKAGWKMEEGILTNEQGIPFEFDVILPSPYYEKMVLSWARSLRLLGIDVSVYVLNPSQYNHLKQSHNFDVIFHTWHQKTIPGRELLSYWSSGAADSLGSENYPGIKDPVVDDLIAKILKAKNYEKLIRYAKTLDRILRAGYYTLPLAHLKKEYVAYHHTIDHPKLDPGMTSYFISWWAK